MKFCVHLVAIVCMFSSVAFADNSEARQHYESATAHFAVGEFAEAAAEYQAAFKAKPDPALLYDAAQAYRLANNPEKALILYRNYLQLYPNEANISEVRAQIEKLKDAVAAAEKAKTSPPTGTNEPKRITAGASAPEPAATNTQPSPEASRAAAPSPVATHEVVETERPPHAKPIYKKWWFWTAVGVVVAGGVATAVVLSTRSSGSWSNAPDVGPGSRNGLTVTAVRW